MPSLTTDLKEELLQW